jgi:type II secretory pathway component PulJ
MKKRFAFPGGNSRGFMLLEIMLAVFIFSMGVITLGAALSQCLNAQRLRNESERARLALQNRMAEIQANPAMPDDSARRPMKGAFAGIIMVEKRKVIEFKNEEGVIMSGLNQVTLTAEWPSDGDIVSRTLTFYLLRGG